MAASTVYTIVYVWTPDVVTSGSPILMRVMPLGSLETS